MAPLLSVYQLSLLWNYPTDTILHPPLLGGGRRRVCVSIFMAACILQASFEATTVVIYSTLNVYYLRFTADSYKRISFSATSLFIKTITKRLTNYYLRKLYKYIQKAIRSSSNFLVSISILTFKSLLSNVKFYFLNLAINLEAVI